MTEANTVGGDLLPAPERTEILERGGAFTDTRGRVCSPENWKLDAGAPFASAFDHSDGNGNVTFLMYTNGMQAAKYLYDPYGNMLAMSGPLASANKYRFSSKEWNDNAGLYYYLYRFYDPDLQRWLSRDPLGERGILPLWENQRRLQNNEDDLYEFVMNSPTYKVDPDGRFIWVAVCCTACVGFNLWDMYDAIHDGSCAGKSGADLAACALQNALNYSGLGDLSSCLASAIASGVKSGSPQQAADNVADCFKCASAKEYRDLAKAASCACCGASLLSKLGSILGPVLSPVAAASTR